MSADDHRDDLDPEPHEETPGGQQSGQGESGGGDAPEVADKPEPGEDEGAQQPSGIADKPGPPL